MLQLLTLKYSTVLVFVPFVMARSHKYSLASPSSVRYTDINAYYENISTMQCLALCERKEHCASINYNLDTERCELTPHVPRVQTPAPASETNWRVYHNDRIIRAIGAWQSSTYYVNSGPLSADLAIDGNRDNSDSHNGQHLYCAHTNNTNSSWAMEFENAALVGYVVVYFRNNVHHNYSNQNLRLLISTTRQECDNNIGNDCATYRGPPLSPSPPVKITCTQPVTGKFLKIISNNPAELCLCEVEVYFV